jgi:hypothetical protein
MEDTVKIRTLLVGTAVAGALAAGIAASPAQAATTSTASTTSAASAASAAQAQSGHHDFSPIWSGYGRGEDSRDRSYFSGSWYENNGWYYFDGHLFDRDRDNQYSYIDLQWHDRNGWHDKIYRGSSYGSSHYLAKFRRGSFDHLRIRTGEGTPGDYNWGTWHTFA